MSGRPSKIVIVGRDAALWLTATALREALGPIGVSVTAIELPSRLHRASVYTTLPAIETLHSKLGIDEAALLRSTRGSFSLGWNVVPTGSPPFLVAHGSYGAPIDGADFFPYWLKGRHFGLQVALENFSPTAMAARHGRVLVPDESTERFGRADYAYLLPAITYAGMLKSRAQQLGVTINQTVQAGVERHGISGEIHGVIPDDGTLIGGDFFIDASGVDGTLIGTGLGTGIEDWGNFFPFNQVLTASGKRFASVPTYSEIRMLPHSWTALQGTQGGTNVVFALHDDGSAGEAVASQASRAAGLALTEIEISHSAPGRRLDAWAANCVAIGTAACAFDPLFDLELHTVQLGIVHLLSLFPACGEATAERAEFNRIMRSLFERLREYQSATYVLAGITAAAPESVRHKIETFRARGAVAAMEDETFSPDQWRALFVGLGMTPESWPPSIDRTAPEQMKESFRRILAFVHDKVLEQPKHDQFLVDIGASA
jgi:tryptophan halogenase